MRLVYLMSELLQEGYYMPSRLKEEKIQHMHECLHVCLHSFQHYAAYRKIYPQHRVGEELIDKDVIDHDSFLRTRKVCGDPFYQGVLTIQAPLWSLSISTIFVVPVTIHLASIWIYFQFYHTVAVYSCKF